MNLRFDTKVTRLFGIEIPVIQGAMAWLSEAALVAAVSNEGGLGVLGASIMSVEDFEPHVVEARRLTKKPFGVNFPLVLGEYSQHLEMCLRHGVRVFFISAGSSRLHTPRIKAAGALCVHVVPNLKLALNVEANGVDAVVLESYEAGGHVSTEGITSITNIPNVARQLKVPLIAAGGIVDGRGVAAALCLGADGVQMGTRFLATHESNAHPVYKEMLLKATEFDAPVHSRMVHPGRALRSPFVDRVMELERNGATPEDIRAVIGRGRARKAAHHGDLENGMFYSGSGAGNIHHIMSVKEVFAEIKAELVESLGRAQSVCGIG